MSQADELLRDLIAAWDEDRGIVCAVKAARAYLNEPYATGGHSHGEEQRIWTWPVDERAPPPHAAVEPEKPVAWMYTRKGISFAECEQWPYAKRNRWTETPLYAAVPVAWNETIKRLDAAIAYKWERWQSHFNRDDYIDFFRGEFPAVPQPIARDEFICARCGIRVDSTHDKGDF